MNNLYLRGSATLIECEPDFKEQSKVNYKGPNGVSFPLKDDLWELQDGTAFRTENGLIIEIIPKKENEDMQNQETTEKDFTYETEDEKVFIDQCIRSVMDAGETDNPEQAYAICKMKYDEKQKSVENQEETTQEEMPEGGEETPEADPVVELTNKLNDLITKLDELSNRLDLLEGKSIENEKEYKKSFTDFSAEIDDRIKKINLNVQFAKIDTETDNLTEKERYFLRNKK